MSESLALASSDLCAYGSAVLPHFEAPTHVRAVADRLEAVERGEVDRLMIFAPPRHGKSESASVLFPTWAIGRDPRRSVIAASYSAELATDFGRRCRNLVGSPAYGQIFGTAARLSEDSGAMHRFATRAGGTYYALGVGGPAVGRGADLLLVDDPIRSREEALSEAYRESLWSWWRYVASTRLNPRGRVVLIATRWHQADLPGRILAEEGARWTVLSLPALASADDPLGRAEGAALWPERFDGAALAAIRGSIGGAAFESLYQQNPVAAEGLVFKTAWLQGRFDPTAASEITRTVQSWDCSFGKTGSSDFSACATIGQGRTGYYVLHVFKARLDFPTLKKKMQALAAEWRPSAVLVEDTASGQSAVQELKKESALPLIPVKATKEKLVRWEAVSPLFESGRVFFAQGAGWLEETIGELAAAPAASHDDVTDAIAQGLAYLRGGAMFSIDELLEAEKDEEADKRLVQQIKDEDAEIEEELRREGWVVESGDE